MKTRTFTLIIIAVTLLVVSCTPFKARGQELNEHIQTELIVKKTQHDALTSVVRGLVVVQQRETDCQGLRVSKAVATTQSEEAYLLRVIRESLNHEDIILTQDGKQFVTMNSGSDAEFPLTFPEVCQFLEGGGWLLTYRQTYIVFE